MCGGFLALVNRKSESAAPKIAQGVPAKAAVRAISRSSLLLTLGLVVLLGAVGAALLDYVFKFYATEAWGRGSDLLRFFAFFHTGVALLSFLMQSAVAKVFLQKFGLGKTVLTLPATLLGGSFLALLISGFVAAAAARAAEASVRGSLFGQVYETCYTPVPAAEKRLAKTFIDVGSERGGDALGAAIVLVVYKNRARIVAHVDFGDRFVGGICFFDHLPHLGQNLRQSPGAKPRFTRGANQSRRQ